MPTRRGLLGSGSLLVVAGCLSGGSETSSGGAGASVSSPAFTPGSTLPTRFTCDGEDVSPPLRLREPPDVTSLAVIVEDPDARAGPPFVHWLVWNIPPETEEIPAAIPSDPTVSVLEGAVQGTNDFDDLGYRGPCPPADDGPHTYRFTVQLLDTTLELDPGASPEAFRSTVEPHVRGKSTITATYERS